MSGHVSVLLPETVALLAPQKGDRILDVTLGLGGHASALLSAAGETGTLTALDADADNLGDAQKHLAAFGDRALLIHANFSELPGCLPEDRREFDVIIADLGLSSPHLDDPSRGFSFRADAPLDMRFDRTRGQTAAMLLASLDKVSLIAIFKEFGEIRFAHKLVDVIIARRKADPVRTTGALKDAVLEAYGQKTGGDLLPQVFQAVRMAVNGELKALDHFLTQALLLLAPGGRLAVITFHSLEDRVVKNRFRDAVTPRKDPITGADASEAAFEPLSKKAIDPSDEEKATNPRSRSARLRAIRRKPHYTSSR
jgi:16S rRNA (cytosine1402-N4)-methyltransferase